MQDADLLISQCILGIDHLSFGGVVQIKKNVRGNSKKKKIDQRSPEKKVGGCPKKSDQMVTEQGKNSECEKWHPPDD